MESRRAKQKAPTRIWFAALFAVVLLSRLPFIGVEYGQEFDAWRVARAARHIAESGEYETSRAPGYPVQEIVCSWIWRGGPWAINGATAIFSAIAATALAAVARRMGGRDWWLAGLAFAVVPVVYVGSVNGKDYLWSLAFVMLSICAVLRARPLSAGVLLGLACGCRITAAAMILPLGLMLLGELPRTIRIAGVARLLLATFATALAAYSPVLLRYGFGATTFYESLGRPTWQAVITLGTLDVWGAAGLVGISIAAIGGCVRLLRRDRPPTPDNALLTPALVLMAAIYLAAYVRLPHQAGYLIPFVSAVILLAVRWCPRPAFFACAGCLLMSPFVSVSRDGIGAGCILADHTQRVQNTASIRRFLDFAESLPGHNVIVVGAWEPQIAVLAPERLHGHNDYFYTLDEKELLPLLREGRPVWFMPEIREFNLRVNRLDLARYGARDLRLAR